ncbi:MAG TPA: YbhB/YbcL family Raf kinase inhibitor-like protein [Acidobacteriota bacterium]|nr:YbhB/YbcL family Raf kinase inhibitor-like protein [Acidobacteriota bacterium]
MRCSFLKSPLIVTAWLLVSAPVMGACEQRQGGGDMSLYIKSSAFGHGEAIPARYTCDGEDVSPPLTWGEIPSGAKTLALIMDDPDAPVGTWDHWILYNIPVNLEGLPENYPAVGETPNGTRSGRNSWGRLGYGGPCPPSGTHRYFFRLYALDRKLDLAPGATSGQVRAAMSGSILAEAELYGTYRRARGR